MCLRLPRFTNTTFHATTEDELGDRMQSGYTHRYFDEARAALLEMKSMDGEGL